MTSDEKHFVDMIDDIKQNNSNYFDGETNIKNLDRFYEEALEQDDNFLHEKLNRCKKGKNLERDF